MIARPRRRPPGPPAAALAAGLLFLGCAPAHDADRLFTDLQSPDLEARQDAAERLERVVREGDHAVFVRGLSSPNPAHQIQSIFHLARMPQPGARAALRDLLRIERRLLLPYNPIRMKPSSEPSDSRILVAHLIAQGGGDPQAVDALLDGMDGGRPGDVVAGACYAAGALKDPRAIPFLTSALDHADAEAVRAAVQALGRYRQPESLAALERVARHPALIVRSELLSALELQDLPESQSIVRQIATSDPEPDVRAEALRHLARYRDPDLVPFLIGRLRGEHPTARAAALTALEAVTGQALGPEPTRWSRWWERSGGRLRPGRGR
jgi:HEAT repeat protein